MGYDGGGDEFKSDNHQVQVGRRFPPLERKFDRVARGKSRYSINNQCSTASILNEIKVKLNNDLPNAMNFIRTSLASLKKSLLKEIHTNISDNINTDDEYVKYSHWYTCCLDIIECKLYKPPKKKVKKATPSNICKVFFCNKGVEMINLPRIFHNSTLSELLPSIPNKFEVPTVIYKLKDTIASTIFNYNKFAKSVDLNRYLEDETYLPCECNDSVFADEHHKHIITGDLRIVENPKLRKLFSKGPKYREPVPINWQEVVGSVSEGLNNCINKWCSLKAINADIFIPWKEKVLELVQDQITVLQNRMSCNMVSEVLKDPVVVSALKCLHEKYVLCPIDKATGNISFICKRFYAKVLADELGIRNNRPNNSQSTYIKEDIRTDTDIIAKNKADLFNKFNLSLTDNQERLPHMYWLPKKHKNPVKFRFIVAAPECSIKPLARNLTDIFKLFYQQIEQYNKKATFFSGVNTFWCVQNNSPIRKSINKLNLLNKAKSISTFDFSTLYTKIPHNKLIYVLNSLVDFCFNGGSCKFVAITSQGAKWVDNPQNYNICFNKCSIKKAVIYLLQNCFFTVGKALFRQRIGIPMGSDPAPFFANLFLYHYESSWLNNLKKTELHKARKFSNTFRFIDDLCTINDGGEFEKVFQEIYPPEMELGKENNGISKASFLDMDIEIRENQFDLKLFDKREAFPFTIVRMPYALSNMPSTIFYASIGAEILRIARATTDREHFLISCKTFLTRMIIQGAKLHRLSVMLKKTFGRHSEDFSIICGNATTFVDITLQQVI